MLRNLNDLLLAEVRRAVEADKLRKRLEKAVGPCVIPGGRDRYLDILVETCAKAKGVNVET